jgi:hypothetical protein
MSESGLAEGVVAGLQVYQPDHHLAAAVEGGPLKEARGKYGMVR